MRSVYRVGEGNQRYLLSATFYFPAVFRVFPPKITSGTNFLKNYLKCQMSCRGHYMLVTWRELQGPGEAVWAKEPQTWAPSELAGLAFPSASSLLSFWAQPLSCWGWGCLTRSLHCSPPCSPFVLQISWETDIL